jgi:integrase/recombinase XerD
MQRLSVASDSSGVGVPKIDITISALLLFFKVTLDRPDLSGHRSIIHEPRKATVILSLDEVARFLEATPQSRSRPMTVASAR